MGFVLSTGCARPGFVPPAPIRELRDLTPYRKLLVQERTRHADRLHKVLADLTRGTLRKKLPALQQALTGRFRAHHAFLVSQFLAHLDYLDEAVDAVSTQIDTAMAPFHEELARLDTIHGMNKRTAEVLIAELGVDMTVFPTAKHATSWAGLCPGNHESAGKHRSGGIPARALAGSERSRRRVDTAPQFAA